MNIIVIVTDSLRIDHVGCYGSHVQTPNIDRLAEEGVKFGRAYSENLATLPTRRSWWTGQYHFHHAGWQPFTQSDDLLAEVLWDQGYTSALITDVYHMHKPTYNCGRGFDTSIFVRGQEYDPWIVDPDIRVSLASSPVHRMRRDLGQEDKKLWRARYEQYLKNCTALKSEEDYCAPRVIKEAIRWLENTTVQRKDRLFLWVDLFDPHEPWDPPSPYNRMYTDSHYTGSDLVDPVPGEVENYMTPAEIQHTKNLYAGEVSFVDKWMGFLLDRIRELNIDDNTLIVHTSDHGEPFADHGYIRKARPYNYEELIHIPWIMRHPDIIPAGQDIDALVQTVDMMPTLLKMLGIKIDPAGEYDNRIAEDLPAGNTRQPLKGCDLMPLIEGKVDHVRDFAFGGHHNREWYACNEEWAYLLPVDGSRQSELFHLPSDPGEQNNVIATHPETAAHLELQLRRFTGALG